MTMKKSRVNTYRSPRIIAGSAKGTQLHVSPSARVRPTSLRLRESLFGMLDSLEADYSCILDLYAGSGALGIEALSRGEGLAIFVEQDRSSAATIRMNLERVGESNRGLVVGQSVEDWVPTDMKKFTMIFADPPYQSTGIDSLISEKLKDSIAANGVLALEHESRLTPPNTICDLKLYKARRQGKGAVAIYCDEAN